MAIPELTGAAEPVAQDVMAVDKEDVAASADLETGDEESAQSDCSQADPRSQEEENDNTSDDPTVAEHMKKIRACVAPHFEHLHDSVDSLWNNTLKLDTLSEIEWRNSTKDELSRFQQIIFDATKAGWDGTSNPDDTPSWTISSSLLYCVTIITTIGYGHIAPKTDMGRYVTILYAIFGIPICILMLTLIGDGLAAAFRLLYKSLCNICFTGTTMGSGGSVRVPVLVSVAFIIGYIVLGAFLFPQVEEHWTKAEAAYFSFITLSTIGFGDYVPGE
ncbi:potassium channel subfamily K member 6-like [Littorina saxatilis]|uniref:potassium channel subfamily K member 6-like n=1 Tax=Littorina saxatilis TaxID=31220 RepID=UPI0038B59CBA